MKQTIRQLREERDESTMQLAAVLGATLQDIHDLETGIASPSVERLRVLTEHFGVDVTAIDLEPQRQPSFGEQVMEALDP
jgi:DNA-binding XRE family transcriptional regulator